MPESADSNSGLASSGWTLQEDCFSVDGTFHQRALFYGEVDFVRRHAITRGTGSGHRSAPLARFIG